jgi:pimeloyl-[acyl-carrier protein] methyl ester esterase
MDGSGELFAQFVAHLDARIEPIIVRYPASKALGYAALARHVAADLPRDRPYAILGESFSGPLAIMLARAAGVRAVILSCSFAHNPMPALARLGALVDLVPIQMLPKRLIVDYFLGETEDEALMRNLLDVSARLPAEVWRARVKAALAVDVTAQVRGLTQPVLYLRARRDRLVPPAQAELIKQLAPQTEIVDFDTPHFLLQVAPRRAAGVVGDFLQRFPFDAA